MTLSSHVEIPVVQSARHVSYRSKLNRNLVASVRRNSNPRESLYHRIRLRQLLCPIRARHPDHLHSASTRRLNPRRRILNDQTFLRTESQHLSPFQIRLWMRLPISHIIGSYHHLRHGQSAMPQPIRRQQPRSRRHHRPSPIRNRLQQIRRTRHHRDAALIMCLMILDRRSFGLGIQMWRHLPDHLNCPHPVRNRHDRIAIHPFSRGPLSPFTVHLARRITKHTIEVKQNG